MIKNEAPARSACGSRSPYNRRSLLPSGDIWKTNPRARATGAQERLLPRYAEAQLAPAKHGLRLLTTGIPDRGPTQLPLEYRRLLDELAARPTEDGGLAREEAFALEGLLPVYDDRCAELAASPVPDSLQHDDLHSNNACWPGEAGDLSSVRIIDWRDASVGHPFETMLANLNSIAFHAGALHEDRRMDDPRVLRIRDAYMEPFAAWAAVRDYCAGWRWPEVP